MKATVDQHTAMPAPNLSLQRLASGKSFANLVAGMPAESRGQTPDLPPREPLVRAS